VVQAEVESLGVTANLEGKSNDRIVIWLGVTQHRSVLVRSEFFSNQDTINDFPRSFCGPGYAWNFCVERFGDRRRGCGTQQRFDRRILFSLNQRNKQEIKRNGKQNSTRHSVGSSRKRVAFAKVSYQE
jgi:hypothetical protein